MSITSASRFASSAERKAPRREERSRNTQEKATGAPPLTPTLTNHSGVYTIPICFTSLRCTDSNAYLGSDSRPHYGPEVSSGRYFEPLHPILVAGSALTDMAGQATNLGARPFVCGIDVKSALVDRRTCKPAVLLRRGIRVRRSTSGDYRPEITGYRSVYHLVSARLEKFDRALTAGNTESSRSGESRSAHMVQYRRSTRVWVFMIRYECRPEALWSLLFLFPVVVLG